MKPGKGGLIYFKHVWGAESIISFSKTGRHAAFSNNLKMVSILHEN